MTTTTESVTIPESRPDTRPVATPVEQDQGTIAVETGARTVTVLAALTLAGVLGRAAFQWLPSVEPLLPLAILTAFTLGARNGAAVGAAGFVASNFLVYGFQGPWTVFQVIGAGAAAYTAGVFGRKTHGRGTYVLALVSGTAVYEVVVNLGSLTHTPWAWTGIPAYFVLALPFGLVHVASSLGFGLAVLPFHDRLRRVSDAT